MNAPHRRFNQLTGEWVMVSPHRTQRPWLGQREKQSGETRPAHDPSCYLCPGSQRAGGMQNPKYTSTFVFDNDFAALLPSAADMPDTGSDLLQAQNTTGECRVICFSPRHDLTLAEMPLNEIGAVIDVWKAQTADLGKKYKWVQVFENKGAIMGCSNPHPHGQVWAMSALPNEPAKEDATQRAYFERHHRLLLQDYAALELQREERVVLKNDDWLVVVPYWAVWPYETLVLPRFAAQSLTQITDAQRDTLADALKRLLVRYDNLFETSFPYSMGWHGVPVPGDGTRHWQVHAHFYPPLLRSAAVKKFMVGFEMLGEAQRDLTAEQAAERLRELPEKHYKEG
ncbi:MAG TPA: UDP-glucose--hexose-1-phosphate uridylyltransferase [Thermoflexales bacterium]|nr:UDP-glucose--hexose-1-phosphate uridylyltransferase [Thermoflexales bacterium]HQW35047.1 UDP-glucose--hexose-1-phosphate uridylyltransferase [Thermoflexales bacterium]HQZ22648.1 UDP-glucose--hexose-1-phosphate uridylyltransferase [Thermoflexales bacterium]HRA00704.1 UDP-glucose--hexose-1-phosphate uridylyltransferase [Thermoflexales bacterium]